MTLLNGTLLAADLSSRPHHCAAALAGVWMLTKGAAGHFDVQCTHSPQPETWRLYVMPLIPLLGFY